MRQHRALFPQQRVQPWLRPLVVAGVLLLSAYLAPGASPRRLALLLGAGSILAALRWPPLGLAALIVAGLVVPFAIGTGTQTELNAAVLLLPVLTALWILDMVRRRDVRLARSGPIPPLLALAGAAILAFLAGLQPWFALAQTAPLPAQLGGLAIFLLSAGAFLLAAHQVRDVHWLQRLTWLFLSLGAVYVAGRLVPRLGAFTAYLFPPGAAGSLFWTWLVALAFGQAAFNRSLRLLWRLALGGVVCATLYVGLALAGDWESGWVPPLVAVAVILWSGAPRLGRLAILAGVAVAALNLQWTAGLVLGGGNDVSLTVRLEFWRTLAQIIGFNPLLGLGPANYSWYAPLFPTSQAAWGYVKISSHNNYVDIVAQLGLLGLACFLWFVWEVGRLGWRLRARVSPGFPQAYVHGALGGLAGTLAAAMLGDWVLPFVYNVGLAGFRASVLGWLFLGGLVALEQIACRPTTMDEPRDPGRRATRGPDTVAG